MGAGSYLSPTSYAPRHHRRFTIAWCYIVVIVIAVDVISAKDSLKFLTSPTMVMQRRSAQGKHSGGSIAPAVMVPRGGTSDDDDVAATATQSTDNAKNPPPSDAPVVVSAATTVLPSDATNFRTKLRNVVFPIYGEETTKFLLIGSIKFFVILALTITRDNKDTMVVTECGAEAIAFLKVSSLACVFPRFDLPIAYYLHLTFHSTLQDLWSFAGSNLIHRYILQNGKYPRQETTILRHMHSVLRVFLPL